METREKHFRCPSCREKISILVDTSVDGLQKYIEDCEVCCRPIEFEIDCQEGKIIYFTRTLAYD